MNTSKPAKSNKTKASKPVKSEATSADMPAAPEAKSTGALSSVEIGHVAGDLWGLLIRDGSLTVTAIKKALDAPGDMVVAAIGWLARENKLEFSTEKRSVKISLRQ